MAEEELAPVVAKTPWEGLARSTLALARLRQGQFAAALEAFTQAHQDLPASEISLSVLKERRWEAGPALRGCPLANSSELPLQGGFGVSDFG